MCTDKDKQQFVEHKLLVFTYTMGSSEMYTKCHESRDRAVGVGNSFKLHDPGVRVRAPLLSRISRSPLRHVGTVADPGFYPIDRRDYFTRVKADEA
jgi:hypothetical protein